MLLRCAFEFASKDSRYLMRYISASKVRCVVSASALSGQLSQLRRGYADQMVEVMRREQQLQMAEHTHEQLREKL